MEEIWLTHNAHILGCPKSLFGHNIVRENLNQFFGQPDAFVTTVSRLPGMPSIQNAMRSEGREDREAEKPGRG